MRQNRWDSSSLNSLFSTHMAISETKVQGWRAIPTQWRKASDILTSTLATFLFSSHPKRERDREAHLNYNTNAYNRSRQLLHRKTKLNQIRQKRACILYSPNIYNIKSTPKKLKPGLVASYDLRPGNGVGLWKAMLKVVAAIYDQMEDKPKTAGS